MERGQSLATSPLFDGRNCAYWKRRMCDFHYSIDDSIWTFVEEGWIVFDKPNAKWDKATKDKFNAKNKAVNAIFCGGTSYRQCKKVPKESKTQSFKCLRLALKCKRWVKMNHLTHSIPSLMK